MLHPHLEVVQSLVWHAADCTAGPESAAAFSQLSPTFADEGDFQPAVQPCCQVKVQRGKCLPGVCSTGCCQAADTPLLKVKNGKHSQLQVCWQCEYAAHSCRTQLNASTVGSESTLLTWLGHCGRTVSTVQTVCQRNRHRRSLANTIQQTMLLAIY